jgi:hypothetical protein
MGISKRMKWEVCDGWRGHLVPVEAVGGANDTGDWSDSQCPTDEVSRELSGYTKLLRDAGIKFRSHCGRSSNVFMVSRYILCGREDRERALEIAEQYQSGTQYFYAVRGEVNLYGI